VKLLAGVAAAALVLAACGDATVEEPTSDTGSAASGAGTSEDPADDDAEVPAADLQVVSTVAPIADVVAQVLGDRGEVTPLIPAGADSHTYEPRPSDVVPLDDADLFIGNGLDLNVAAVELAEANLPEDAPLVLLGDEALTAEDLSDEHWHEHGESDGDGHSHGDDGHDDDGHSHDDDGHSHDDDGHSHDDDGHSHGDGANPHVWTSVPNVLAYVDVVESSLTDLDPDGADHYADRADAYRERLFDLDDAIRDAVDTLEEERRRLVVYHDAWAYFGDEYGVEVIAAVQPSDYSEPSASDVRAIIDQIRDEDVPAVFGADEFPTSVIDTIAAETGASYVGDLADDTLPGEPGEPDHTYVGMMVDNVAAIVDALGGDPSALEALHG
jgi:ABC-type Zn uptake system ZnuABC Zn-binding protein ZnuA